MEVFLLNFLLSRNRCGAEEEGMRNCPRILRCGCGVQRKMEEISRFFESRGFDVVTRSEKRLKGTGEVVFGAGNWRL